MFFFLTLEIRFKKKHELIIFLLHEKAYTIENKKEFFRDQMNKSIDKVLKSANMIIHIFYNKI